MCLPISQTGFLPRSDGWMKPFIAQANIAAGPFTPCFCDPAELFLHFLGSPMVVGDGWSSGQPVGSLGSLGSDWKPPGGSLRIRFRLVQHAVNAGPTGYHLSHRCIDYVTYYVPCIYATIKKNFAIFAHLFKWCCTVKRLVAEKSSLPVGFLLRPSLSVTLPWYLPVLPLLHGDKKKMYTAA